MLSKGLLWQLSGKESTCDARDTGDTGSISWLGRSPGGRHGNPLQYSCLENPMDGGAWWSKGSKSWTRLSDFTFHFHFRKLHINRSTKNYLPQRTVFTQRFIQGQPPNWKIAEMFLHRQWKSKLQYIPAKGFYSAIKSNKSMHATTWQNCHAE